MILLCEEGAWKWAFLAFLLDEETFLLYFIFYGGEIDPDDEGPPLREGAESGRRRRERRRIEKRKPERKATYSCRHLICHLKSRHNAAFLPSPARQE